MGHFVGNPLWKFGDPGRLREISWPGLNLKQVTVKISRPSLWIIQLVQWSQPLVACRVCIEGMPQKPHIALPMQGSTDFEEIRSRQVHGTSAARAFVESVSFKGSERLCVVLCAVCYPFVFDLQLVAMVCTACVATVFQVPLSFSRLCVSPKGHLRPIPDARHGRSPQIAGSNRPADSWRLAHDSRSIHTSVRTTLATPSAAIELGSC